MKLSRDPSSPFFSNPGRGEGWCSERWATPFSGFRWAVPHLAGGEGRAIYLDSDMIALGDIYELWRQPFPGGAIVLAKGGGSWRYCVSLWNCTEAVKVLPPLDQLTGPNAHVRCSGLMRRSNRVASFAGDWNCLDGEGHSVLNAGSGVMLLHYTSMPHQPHLPRALARLGKAGRRHWFNGVPTKHWRPDLVALFDRLLVEAEENGYPIEAYERDEPFGWFPKLDLAGMHGARPAWGR